MPPGVCPGKGNSGETASLELPPSSVLEYPCGLGKRPSMMSKGFLHINVFRMLEELST